MDDVTVLGRPLELAELESDPHGCFHRLRTATPVCWIGAVDGWVVLTREHASAVMRDADAFTVDDPRFSTAQVIGASMLSLDGEDHRRHRAPFWDALRRADLGAFIDDQAHALVAGIAPDGRNDLRAALAGPLAARVVAELLGLPLERADELRGWYARIVEGVTAVSGGAPLPDDARGAYAELSDAVASSATSAGSVLADAARALPMDEVVRNAAVILFGGIETVDGAVTCLLWHLLVEPPRLAAVRRERGLVDAAVEESFRLEPAASRVDRYATRDVEVGGVRVRRGELVIVSLAAANRDPDVFHEPDRFELGRPDVRSHVTFAHGPHACIGAHLARQEAAAALRAVLDGLPGLALDPDAPPPSGLVFRKPSTLPVTWTARGGAHGQAASNLKGRG